MRPVPECSLASVLLAGCRCCAFAELVLEPARHGLQVLHASSAWGTTALGLRCPVVRSHFLCRIAAACTSLLLVVEGSHSAAHTQSVSASVPLSLACGTVTHDCLSIRHRVLDNFELQS